MESASNECNQLQNNGFVVLDVYWMDSARRNAIRQELHQTLHTMPEFKSPANSWVLGGFSALGNPSSFHNPFVRRMRQYAMTEVIALMEEMRPNKNYKLEQVIDRLMVRPVGLSPSAESWHRDESALAYPCDQIFGGWWNFDDEDQYFSCVPGSHRGITGNRGFSLIKDAEQKKTCESSAVRVRVPPGSIIVFYEKIVHEVIARKAKHVMLRLFLGWRLTQYDTPLYPVDMKLEMQSVMPLKSNQIPPMYAKLHWTNWREKLEQFTTENIIPECTERKEVASGCNKGNIHTIVHQHMRSLKEYGLPLYPKYEQVEIDMHYPKDIFVVRCGYNDGYRYIEW